MIKVIDYKAGNAPSVMHALEHLGLPAGFAHGPDDLQGASHIILPGVGSAQATMQSLHELGLIAALSNAVLSQGVPFLGICVGMQIIFEHSDEGDADCLGWLPGQVVRFDSSQVRVPQMGWNRVEFTRPALDIPAQDHFYFVNSYHAVPANPGDLWGVADYAGPFAAAVAHDNIFATQFHAEKSGAAGLGLLTAFAGFQG